MNEDAYVSDEEELECPLCMEEFDISDRTFKPCPCGYQICRFCYNRIVNAESANGCPACRRQYTEETVEFKPLSAEEWKKDQQRIQSRKLKEKEKRESEMANRRHLSNMRVVQKNLVYVIGFSPKSADADLAATLRGNDYFAQYGKINKIVVNKKSHPNGQPTVGVYITYARKEDAARAVQAVDNTINDGRVLRASFGTTKYCSAYLRQQVCQNPNCMYLHEPGEDLDSYTREDMSTIQHAAKAAEGMHANALAAHHMRRQPTRTDSLSTTNAETETTSAALPPTASWASLPKTIDPTSDSSSRESDHKKPDSLPPPAKVSKDLPNDLPPPPSQAMHGSVQPSELLPEPVQPGLEHPVLGPTLKSLFQGRFNFHFVPRVMPGLSEADIKSAENFPQLFAWNPQPRRPLSPSKAAKHARSGSRYAFATESSKTPPPGFVPPGLATGLQPPGFSAGQLQSKDGSVDFFSQFLKNSNPQESFSHGGSGASNFEDPAILGLRESVKSPTDVAFNPPNEHNTSIQSLDSDAPAYTEFQPAAPHMDALLSTFSPFANNSTQANVKPTNSFSPIVLSGSPDTERQQSKFGASFARLEHLENQAQEIAHNIDAKVRSTWEPAPRPRDASPKQVEKRENTTDTKQHTGLIQHQLAVPKSSGTWQPSPPPLPQISPSPKPNMPAPQRYGPAAIKLANKAPWEPSPPLTNSRTKSPCKTQQAITANLSTESATPARPSSSAPVESKNFLAQEDFPALGPVRVEKTEPNTPANVSQKKQWDTIPQIVPSPIVSASPRPTKAALARRDSAQSVLSVPQDTGRSRQNSIAESLPGKSLAPSRAISPVTSPLSSRAASPILSTPVLNRTLSNAAPAISSPLANLNTGKQIRILSTSSSASKATEEAKAKAQAERLAAEERAIAKIKEEEAAAAAKIVRKSVPANSIKKTREQKQAEQREKAERRERESVQSSQPEDSLPVPEIAAIQGRARKQKNKAVKTPVKKAAAAATAAVVVKQEVASDRESEEEEEEGHVDATTAKRAAASDAISEVAAQVDLRSFKFFQQVLFNFDISAEELAKGAEEAQWPVYAGKETVEQLETLLTHARKEATEHFKALEKLQRRNMRLARLDAGISA